LGGLKKVKAPTVSRAKDHGGRVAKTLRKKESLFRLGKKGRIAKKATANWRRVTTSSLSLASNLQNT